MIAQIEATSGVENKFEKKQGRFWSHYRVLTLLNWTILQEEIIVDTRSTNLEGQMQSVRESQKENIKDMQTNWNSYNEARICIISLKSNHNYYLTLQ